MSTLPPLTIITIAREPTAVLARFLAWHLSQGAARIIVFLDDPDDPAQNSLAGDPRVVFRPCTASLWAAMGVAPHARFTKRQRAAMTAAYREVETGWVMILDADELMWFAGRDLPSGLAELPPDTATLRVRSAEEVTLPDGTRGFRLPIPRAAVDTIYGDEAALFRPRFGLVGHPEGKSIHRAGLPGVRLKLHWAVDAAGETVPGPVWGAPERAYLLHYFAPGYARWRAKMDWRAGAHGFADPLKMRLVEIASGPDPEKGYHALYDRLHALNAAEMRALDALGGLLHERPNLPGDG
ncbi:glycosyltransferase family 2 protein [Roseicyclus sp.]|uniref:glycosyltransferase family 2 protein n=1 Tax=Roseicyclus sp. TaxID=1914329 RepID=UPI003F6C3C17